MITSFDFTSPHNSRFDSLAADNSDGATNPIYHRPVGRVSSALLQDTVAALSPDHQPSSPTSHLKTSHLKTSRSGIRLSGNPGNNTLRGSAKNDLLRGLDGNDRLIGLGGNDSLMGDRGHDTLLGGADNDVLYGNNGNNHLQGDAGNDRLIGGTGNDRLLGGIGIDTLVSGGGIDGMSGGKGRDRFVLAKTGSNSIRRATVITDFTRGEDTIQLTGLTFAQVSIRPGSGANLRDTIIQERQTSKVLAILQNVDSSTLTGETPDTETPLRGNPGSGTPDNGNPGSGTPDNGNPGSGTPGGETPGGETPGGEGSGILSFSTGNFRVNEAAGVAEVTVTRTGSTDGIVRVNYSTVNNTAIAGQDYSAASGTLVFAAGETSQTIQIPILSDLEFETTEVVRLSLSNAANGGTLGNTKTALLKIINDDAPTEATLSSRSSNRFINGETTIYIGTNQVSTGNDIGNQDPWLASFTNGTLNWYRDDYEITNDDSRGTNLVWDGGDRLYASFTSTGTQGRSEEDFRRFARNGWLKSYSDASPGGGGGGKVGIIARLDPTNGEITAASFLTALNGTKTNSVGIDQLSLADNNNLIVQARSAFAPRKPDKTAMTRNELTIPPDVPNYTVEFAADLNAVVSAIAIGYS